MISGVLLTLIVSGLAMIALGLYSRSHKAVPAQLPFEIMVYLVGAWCLFFALVGLSNDPSSKLRAFQVVLAIAALVPIFTLLTIVYLFGLQKVLTRPRLVCLFAVPLGTIIIDATNGWTSLLVTGYHQIETVGFSSLALEYGPAFLTHTAYSYIIVLATLSLLVWHIVHNPGIYRWRDIIVLAGFSVPFFGNALVITGASGGFDLTPILFVFTCFSLAFALFRYQMLSLMPVARGAVMDISSDPILVLDRAGKLVDLNPKAMTLEGVSSRSIGKEVSTIFRGNRAFMEVLEDKRPDARVVEFRTSAGIRYYDCQVDEMLDNDKQPMGQVIMLRDMTTSKMAEDALRESEERYRAIFDQFLGSIFVVDLTDGSILQANQSFCHFFGYAEERVAGLKVHDIPSIDKSVIKKVMDTVSGGGRLLVETEVTRIDGKTVTLEISASPIRYGGRDAVCVMGWDVTERRQAEADRERIEKLEATGTLAGGIAHDFNNLLTSVLGYVSLTKQRSERGTETFKGLQEAEMAIMQAKEIAQELLSLAKGGSPIRKPVSIAELLQVASNHPFLNSNVDCDLHVPAGSWMAYVDPGQMGRVFTNLFLNAKDAMPQGGTVRVTVSNVITDPITHPTLEPGRYLEITIKDEGNGIPKDVLPKIFEPYFTTKVKGYGLGLSVVYATVTRHNGSIEVESTEGKGTTFTICLPVTDEAPTEIVEEEAVISEGQGRILVMDDEEYVLDVVTELLEALGYDVGVARDGVEAIREYRTAMEAGNRYDVVLVDLTNSRGMGGKEAIEGLLALDASVHAIVSSGYSNDPVMANHTKYGFIGVLPKPYKLEELAMSIKQTMAIE
jgi:two-component system, cell cycle sensor histidine kinase and response regulator CckA